MYRLLISEQANSFYEKLTGKYKVQMKNGLDLLVQDPKQGKPLKGKLKGYWSLRVGMYRILYTVNKQEIQVHVLRIQHRKEVYEGVRA